MILRQFEIIGKVVTCDWEREINCTWLYTHSLKLGDYCISWTLSYSSLKIKKVIVSRTVKNLLH